MFKRHPELTIIVIGITLVTTLALVKRYMDPPTIVLAENAAADAAVDVDDIQVAIPPASSERVNRSLLPQERKQWRSDPESYGWNEGDRQFFEEHGVSESEARAMETIMRENGVE